LLFWGHTASRPAARCCGEEGRRRWKGEEAAAGRMRRGDWEEDGMVNSDGREEEDGR